MAGNRFYVDKSLQSKALKQLRAHGYESLNDFLDDTWMFQNYYLPFNDNNLECDDVSPSKAYEQIVNFYAAIKAGKIIIADRPSENLLNSKK